MNRDFLHSRLSGKLDQAARHDVPDDLDLWPAIARALQRKRTGIPGGRAWSGPALEPRRLTGPLPIDDDQETTSMSSIADRPGTEPISFRQRRWVRESAKLVAAALVFGLVGAILALTLRSSGDEPVSGPGMSPSPIASPSPAFSTPGANVTAPTADDPATPATEVRENSWETAFGLTSDAVVVIRNTSAELRIVTLKFWDSEARFLFDWPSIAGDPLLPGEERVLAMDTVVGPDWTGSVRPVILDGERRNLAMDESGVVIVEDGELAGSAVTQYRATAEAVVTIRNTSTEARNVVLKLYDSYSLDPVYWNWPPVAEQALAPGEERQVVIAELVGTEWAGSVVPLVLDEDLAHLAYLGDEQSGVDITGPSLQRTTGTIVWPALSELRPAQATPAQVVEVVGSGGYVRGPMGFYDESNRSFGLRLAGQAIGEISCYVGGCWGSFQVPGDLAPGEYIVAVEGGSDLTLEAVAATPPANGPAPDWWRIVFHSDRDGGALRTTDIFVMNPDGTDVVRLTQDAAMDFDPAWSPDRRLIAFVSDRESDPPRAAIYVMEADGSNARNLSNDPDAVDSDPAWSPDGEQIAFTRAIDGNTEIFVMNADGTNQRNLTNLPASDEEPAWSPDGSQIIFVSSRDGNDEIYVMDASGANVRRITADPAVDTDPAWSPDGGRIAWASNRANPELDLYVMNVDGTMIQQLTADPAVDNGPSWSPDGATLAFASDRDGDLDIFVMRVDRPDVFSLTDNDADDLAPGWR